jgi:RNA polymerase sigma-70 factor (ECF subfamily)
MAQKNLLVDRFEAARPHLVAVAYRMLGSAGEAEDVVQDAWLRLDGQDAAGIEDLPAWLRRVVARLALDRLRRRRRRAEVPVGEAPAETAPDDPEAEAVLLESVGAAMLVVLERLSPAERLAFVLHDMFAVPFEEIAVIIERSAAAARQLASRARRRVRGGPMDADRRRQKEVVEAFLAASRAGDFAALLAVLDPDVTFSADAAAQRLGAGTEMAGAEAVATAFKGRARTAVAAFIGEGAGLLVPLGRTLRLVLRMEVREGRIAGIEALAEPEVLRALRIGVGET